MIIIVIELLHEIKEYDQSVLNPINFMMIFILEEVIENHSKVNNTLRLWQMKILDKMGLTNKFDGYSSQVRINNSHTDEIEKFGAMKFSHF